MNLMALGTAVEFLGNVLLAISVIFVHMKMQEERKFDGAVVRTLKKEKGYAIAGLVLMVVGFMLELIAFLAT